LPAREGVVARGQFRNVSDLFPEFKILSKNKEFEFYIVRIAKREYESYDDRRFKILLKSL
jgi:hypothetical protein